MIVRAQRPRILRIGCSDSRFSEDVITGSRPGTIFVHRNVANFVSYNDVNVAAIVEYAFKHLRNLSQIKNLHASGAAPRIHGLVYSVENGALKVLVDGRITSARGD